MVRVRVRLGLGNVRVRVRVRLGNGRVRVRVRVRLGNGRVRVRVRLGLGNLLLGIMLSSSWCDSPVSRCPINGPICNSHIW